MKRLFVMMIVGVAVAMSTLMAQPTSSLPIPDEMTFCGEKMSLAEFDRRERFDREQMAFMYLHSTSLRLVKRANRYFPIIEPILKRNGVPDDMKYLAVIESYLDPLAYSPAQAAGLWQFLPSTGKEYGLEVNSEIDERYHVEKATEAACAYLKDAYEKYGCWATTCASYNAGQRRISNELETQNVETSLDLYLVSETTRYVYRILAAKRFLENPAAFNFEMKKEHFYHTVRTKSVAVNYSVSDWADWAKKQGTTYAYLKWFNPWIRDRELHSQGKLYQVQIPLKEDMEFDIKKVKIHYPKWVTD